MKTKSIIKIIIPALIIIITLCFLPSLFKNDNDGKIHGVYHKYPEEVVSSIIFDVVARNHTLLNNMVNTKKFEYNHSWDLLKMYGVYSYKLSELYPDIPFFKNGSVVADYFESHFKNRDLTENDWKLIEQLKEFYFQLAGLQPNLIDPKTGEICKDSLDKLKVLDQQIIDQITKASK